MVIGAHLNVTDLLEAQNKLVNSSMQHHEILFQQQQLTNGSNRMDDHAPQQPDHTDVTTANERADKTMVESKPPTNDDDQKRIKFEDWGFKVDRLFEVAYRFYKRNENKAFHLGFDQRNQMIALTMQARFGNYDGGKAPDIGVLDLVGKRRQYEWSLLKGMSKTEAMTKFICELDDICPIFKAHAEAVKISSGFAATSSGQLQFPNNQSSDRVEQLDQNVGQSLSETSSQHQSIYSSLCKQTYNQFKSFAEKQHPGNVTEQKYLITSLQEQYYQQYISQMHPELKDSTSTGSSNQNSNIPSSMPSPTASEVSTSIETTTVTLQSNLPTPSMPNLPPVPTLDGSEPAPPIETTHELIKMAADGNDMQAMLATEVKELQPVVMSDINCEENNVQTDISCEELNSEFSQVNLATGSVNVVGSPTPTRKPDAISPTSQLKPYKKHANNQVRQQKSLIETVKLFQNTDLPTIGTFESFPEPRLVQAPTQKSTLPIDLINPNLPKLGLTTEVQIPDTKFDQTRAEEPSGTIVPDRQEVTVETSSIGNHIETPAVIPSNDQTTTATYISMDRYDTEQGLGQDMPSVPPAYANGSDHLISSSSGACSSNVQSYPPTEDSLRLSQLETYQPGPLSCQHQQQQHEVPPVRWAQEESSETCSPEEEVEEDTQAQPIVYEPVESATIWTKRAVAEFKESLGGDKQGGVFEVKEGALIVIQVPTYPDGRYIYWEFATDDYDIGFGVDFVYEKSLAQPLALNIYEDNDDDDLEDLIDGDGWQVASSLSASDDPERCQPGKMSEGERLIREKRQRLTRTVPIIPTYRRDSHEEVFVGRHKYPGLGYYLLKFDNTYSVLRSKALYFRICYFM